jgi:cobyrinic acid a,c-diamide synthase
MAASIDIKPVLCPALFLAAPSSGQGKTTVTSALARLLKNQGKIVRVFKTGPDYLDPQILEQASGQAVEQLDIWMAGESYCRQRLYEAAQVADYILVEGAMGLFDGEPSSADLAACFGIPIAVVMDVKGMAQTAAAIMKGLANFRDDISVVGLIANGCSTVRHTELIRDALSGAKASSKNESGHQETDTPLLATFARDASVALPERHLGLVQASEARSLLEERFEAGALALNQGLQVSLEQLFPVVNFSAELTVQAPIQKSLSGLTIAVAKDEAFSFIYQANLHLLTQMGASYVFFSPLHDKIMPVADGLWLPGGYPELHADSLAKNMTMLASITQFYLSEQPILAECGGFLYCLETLVDLEDDSHVMLSLLAGDGAMKGKRGCQGMQTAVLPEGELRGHAHHRSRSVVIQEPISYARRQRHAAPGEAIYRSKGLTASYLHLFFPSNPDAIGTLFSATFEEDVSSKQNMAADYAS